MKKIGLLLTVDGGSVSINDRYFSWASQFGNVQFVNPLDENIYDLDLLIIPGGADVNPARYGAKPHPYCQKPNVYFEWWDTHILPQYIEKNIPIFGICRGFQTLAVHFGATLSQHIAAPYSDPRNKQVEDLEFDIQLQPSDRTAAIAAFSTKKGQSVKVNSLHHQGFYDYSIPKDSPIQILAESKLFQNVEAMMIKGKPIVGVQFHPEEFDCVYSKALILNLLNNG